MTVSIAGSAAFAGFPISLKERRITQNPLPPISHRLQLPILDEPVELLLNPARHRPASDQHSQLHVDGECLLSHVGGTFSGKGKVADSSSLWRRFSARAEVLGII